MQEGVTTPVVRGRWWIVVGSVLGLFVGNGPIMQFTFGVFLKPLAAEFGSDRGTMTLAILVGLCFTGISTPVFGRLIDRYGIRPVALPAITITAFCVAALGLAKNEIQFIIIYGLLGIAAAGQAPLVYARAVSLVFDKQRGLALGIAMAGVGLGAAFLPMLTQALIANFGWRMAYVLLGAILFLIAFPSVAFLVGNPAPPANSTLDRNISGGLSGALAIRTRHFWLLAISFFCVALAVSGTTAHIIPLMGDMGVPPAAAAAAVSVTGLALIMGRLVAGYMLDRFFGPYVALFFFIAPFVGIGLLLLPSSIPVAIVAVMLVGLGVGAEVDLIAYLMSRYFGLGSFGEIYGYLFAVFMLGCGIGPYVMGVIFQHNGSYDGALMIFMAALMIACFLVMQLGPYRFASGGEQSNSGLNKRRLKNAARVLMSPVNRR